MGGEALAERGAEIGLPDRFRRRAFSPPSLGRTPGECKGVEPKFRNLKYQDFLNSQFDESFINFFSITYYNSGKFPPRDLRGAFPCKNF